VRLSSFHADFRRRKFGRKKPVPLSSRSTSPEPELFSFGALQESPRDSSSFVIARPKGPTRSNKTPKRPRLFERGIVDANADAILPRLMVLFHAASLVLLRTAEVRAGIFMATHVIRGRKIVRVERAMLEEFRTSSGIRVMHIAEISRFPRRMPFWQRHHA